MSKYHLKKWGIERRSEPQVDVQSLPDHLLLQVCILIYGMSRERLKQQYWQHQQDCYFEQKKKKDGITLNNTG